MANNLTLSVTLTGDGRQLSGTLRNAQGEVREFGGTTERESGRAERALEGTGRQAQTVSGHLNRMRSIALGAATALVGMAGGLSLSRVISETAQFEDSILGLQAVTGSTVGQIAQLEAQARTLGATSMFSAKQAADAQRFLAQAGFDVNEVMAATPGVLNLAVAGQMDLAQAADIASNVLGGMRLEVDQLNRVNNVLAATSARSNTNITQLGEAFSYAGPFAASAGISIETTSAAIGVLSDAGLQASRAGTGLIGIIRQLSNVTPQAAGVLENYGLSIEDVNIEAHGLETVLERIQAANISTADAFAIFGSEAGAAAQILAAGAGRVREFSGELNNVEGAVDRMAEIIGSGLTGSIRGFNSMLSESILQLGESGVSGAFQLVINNATGVLAVYNDMLPTLAEANNLTDQQVARIETLASGVDLLGDALVITTGIFAGRYVGAIATSQAALAAKTAVVATTTGAINLLTGATTRQAAAATAMAGATRVATGALALIGGPAGAAVIAAGAIYYFREELGLTQRASKTTEEFLGDLREGMGDLDEAAIGNRLDVLVHDLIEVSLQAQETFAQLERLREAPRMYGQGMAADQRVLEQQTEQRLEEQRNKINALTQAIQEHRDRRNELTSTSRDNVAVLEDMTVTAQRLAEAETATAAATNELTRATNAQATAIENLRNRLIPGRRETVQLAKETNTLALAMAMGRGNTAQLAQMMGLLQQEYIEGQRETDNLAIASEDASQRIANSFLSWETVADNTLRRIDDSGQSLWLGLIDGSESALDTVKRGFQQTLAEIAHMLTTQRLTFHVAGMMGLDTTGMPGGGGGLNFGSMGSLYSSATKLPYVGDAISGVGSALGFGSSAAAGGLYANALTGSAAAGGLYAGASTGAAVGGLYGNALTGAATTAGGGFMSAASAAMPWVGGALLVDNVLGLGIVDGIVGGISSLFGGRKTAPKFELATVGQDVDPTRHGLFENYGEGVYSRGALGTVGFYDPNTARLEETFDGFDNAKAFLDSITALDNALVGAVANLDNGAEKTQAMASAAQAVRLNASDAAGIANQLATRTLAVVDVIDGDFSASLRGLGLNAEQITGRVVQAANAMQLLDSNSARLNLQFDASAAGAMRAADGMAQLMGGVGNLNASLGSFYDAFYTEEEKLRHLAEDLSSTFASMGRELPTTREGVRDVVESLELMGAAGQEQLATILQLNGPLAQYIAAMEEQRAAAVESGEAIDDNAESMRAMADIARERAGLERELLSLQGNTAELRRRELARLDPSNQALQSNIWALGDVQGAYQQVEKAVNAERQILENAYRATTASINANISTVQQAMQESAAVADTLSNSLDTLLNARRRESMASRRAAQDYLQSTLASGGLGDSTQLEQALGVVSEPSEGLFSSFTDYQRDFYQTANVIASLEERAEAQVSVEEQSLKALENQLQAAERQYAREMESLDSMLVQQQLQIENELGQMAWLESINGSVLGVGEAIGGLQSAISSAISSAAASAASAAKAASEASRASAASSSSSGYRVVDNGDSATYFTPGGGSHTVRGAGAAALLRSTYANQLDGSHADGLWSVPFDGYRAELHRSETVLPAPAAQAFRDFAGSGGGGGEMLKAFQQLIKHVENLEKEVSELKSINKGTASHTSKIASTVDRMRRETME